MSSLERGLLDSPFASTAICKLRSFITKLPSLEHVQLQISWKSHCGEQTRTIQRKETLVTGGVMLRHMVEDNTKEAGRLRGERQPDVEGEEDGLQNKM